MLGSPTLRIEGSIAAYHLGLYGIPNPNAGTVTAGWSKHFTYPTNDDATPAVDESFWLARPPWWPGFAGNEWAAA